MQHYRAHLRSSRVARGLTLRELAQRAGISTIHLWCIEKGRRGASASVVASLAEALELNVSEELHASGVLRKKKSAAPKRPSRAAAQEAGDSRNQNEAESPTNHRTSDFEEVPMTAESLSQAGGGTQGETE